MRLPPGWTFKFQGFVGAGSGREYRVSKNATPLFSILVDSLIPIKAHIKYIWAREAEYLGETKVGAGVRQCASW